jgi:adenosylhomocysteine nucleosidase
LAIIMAMIGLVAALTQERDTLLRHVKGWKWVALGSFRGTSFELSGQTCLLVTSGMGVRRAQKASRILVEANALRLLVSFGIAGAVEEDLKIGDVVVAEAVCRLEQEMPGPLLPLAPWSDAAREAAVQVLAGRSARLFTGTAVTTRGSQVTKSQLGDMMHPVLEMETAGIAQVAAEAGIPLLSLRAISDGPSAPIPINLVEMMDEDANLQTVRLLRTVIRHPKIVLQVRRLMRNTRIAADNVAVALVAALSQTDVAS